MEDVSNAIVLYVDWDDPELNEQRPHQRRVCQELLHAIYGSFHLLWTLSEGKLGSCPTLKQCALSNPFLQAARLSEETIATIDGRRTELLALVDRMKSSTLLDTQESVFRVSAKVAVICEC